MQSGIEKPVCQEQFAKLERKNGVAFCAMETVEEHVASDKAQIE